MTIKLNVKHIMLNNIMLGQEIITDACVLDYYDQTADETKFMVYSYNNENYTINGSHSVLISCAQFEEISVTGSKPNLFTYSVSCGFQDRSKRSSCSGFGCIMFSAIII